LKKNVKEYQMHNTRMAIVTLAAVLSGSLLSAEPQHSGKKESYSQRSEMKRNPGIERSGRSSDAGQRIAQPKKERTPQTSRPALKQESKSQRKQLPYTNRSRPLQRPRYWVPPGAKPLPPYYRPGYVTRTLPNVAITLTLGSLLFYYADGIYYRHHDSGFVVIAPPIGLIVPVLPMGYTVFYLRGITYYYYADVYYVWDLHHRAYRVVEVPEEYAIYHPGDIVDTLPDGAYTVTIDGVQYYRYGGVYFMQAMQGDRIVYVVVTP